MFVVVRSQVPTSVGEEVVITWPRGYWLIYHTRAINHSSAPKDNVITSLLQFEQTSS